MSEHTPGPWRIAAVESRNYRIEEDTSSARGPIARVMGGDVRSEADARLIAAAPKLLAACEAEEWLDEDAPTLTHEEYGARRRDIHAMRKAALTKARGES